MLRLVECSPNGRENVEGPETPADGTRRHVPQARTPQVCRRAIRVMQPRRLSLRFFLLFIKIFRLKKYYYI
jgi:hypothetical protein